MWVTDILDEAACRWLERRGRAVIEPPDKDGVAGTVMCLGEEGAYHICAVHYEWLEYDGKEIKRDN